MKTFTNSENLLNSSFKKLYQAYISPPLTLKIVPKTSFGQKATGVSYNSATLEIVFNISVFFTEASDIFLLIFRFNKTAWKLKANGACTESSELFNWIPKNVRLLIQPL